MMYSKFLKHANIAVGQNLKTLRFSQRNKKSLVSFRISEISLGSCIYLNNRQYSTILTSKLSDFPKPFSKSAFPLNFTALLSTDGSNEYKIVITNPTEGTSTTLNSSLTSATNIKDVEEIPLPTSDLTNIPTSLTEDLTSVTDVVTSVADVVEPSLASLGLCHWTPVGLIQMMLEHMHVAFHWPWWLTIVTTTVIGRILLFPILLKTQKNALNMSNNMPQLQFLQMKFGEARRTGNSIEAAKLANEMMHFMKEKNINPVKSAIWPLMQAPVFISFFFALRKMANVPVESMKYGGIYWVTDLTIPDPYYVMPLVACGTLYIVLKVGAESGVRMENLKMAKYFLRALPVIALPFCINFPTAILYYWCTNNICTLAVVSFLKVPSVRQYFNLPVPQPPDPRFALPKKGFVQGVKEAYEDQKVLAAIEDRRRMDTVRFQKSATGPIPRTYSYDPTKPRPSNVAATASKSIVAKQRKI